MPLLCDTSTACSDVLPELIRDDQVNADDIAWKLTNELLARAHQLQVSFGVCTLVTEGHIRFCCELEQGVAAF